MIIGGKNTDLKRLTGRGKQSYVNFWEIPGQNKKKLKHNECHNLMFLEILSNVHQRRK
jgi:hypothetical protein